MPRRKFTPLAMWLRGQDPTTLLGSFGVWVSLHHPHLLHRTSDLLVLETRMDEHDLPYQQREAVRAAYYAWARARHEWERVHLRPEHRSRPVQVAQPVLDADAQASDAPFYPANMVHPAPARFGVH
jgi:hypothetical protein